MTLQEWADKANLELFHGKDGSVHVIALEELDSAHWLAAWPLDDYVVCKVDNHIIWFRSRNQV